MRNLGTLFGYEMKKIWKRKLMWVALLTTVVVSVSGVLPDLRSDEGGNFHVTYKDGREVRGYVTEKEKTLTELEWAPKLNGQVMDEAFFRRMRESLQNVLLSDGDAVFQSNVQAHFLMVDPTYYGYYLYMNWGGNIEHMTEKQYYTNAWRQRQADLKSFNYGKLTEEEIAYWTQQSSEIQVPYQYSYYVGWESINRVMNLTISLLLPLLIGICLCDVFSAEYQRRTDALIFASRRGRLPLYLAKGIAGVVTTVLVLLLVIGPTAMAALLIYGGGWFDAPIQLATATCWPITMGEALLIRLGLCLAYALLCGGIVLLVSLLTGSGVAGLTAAFVLAVQQIFLPRFLIEAAWVPGNILSGSTFHRYQLVSLFGMQFNWVELDMTLYMGIGLLLLVLCGLGWRRKGMGQV